ncbi:hypothetical protein RKE25_22110 (plasmid) [Dyella sp. BiH032]|uniref:hypothetical protein n=1 Tax=Dyella sp. BiH032 TaxID=3075430 RepID=UPI0028932F68|nr:hypothetical protein [Dyella sp. BiH032]WNL48426.1 hypothetical protein RKE25_22110 [Dyella sp. BiH032]
MSRRNDNDSALEGFVLGVFGIAAIGYLFTVPFRAAKRWGLKGLLLFSSVLATVAFWSVQLVDTPVDLVSPDIARAAPTKLGDAVDLFFAGLKDFHWGWLLGGLYLLTVVVFLVGSRARPYHSTGKTTDDRTAEG